MKPLESRQFGKLGEQSELFPKNFIDKPERIDDINPIVTPNRFGLDDTGRILPVKTAAKKTYRIDYTFLVDGQEYQTYYYSRTYPTTLRGAQRMIDSHGEHHMGKAISYQVWTVS